MDRHPRTRMPLTVRAAQALPPRRKMDGLKQRTYGKQGHTAASRACLKENFIDENDLEEDLIRLTIDDPVPCEYNNQGSQEPTATKERKGKSRAAFLERVHKHQKVATCCNSSFTSFFKALTSPQLTDPKLTEYIRPLLVEADSSDVVNFSAWANRLSKKYEIVKVAEGSFGEVFKLRRRKKSVTVTTELAAHEGVIFKVVPLHTESGPGSKNHYATSIEGIIRESKVLKTMAVVPGFTGFRQLHVVQGKYPDSFVEAFRDFQEAGNACDGEDPQHFSSEQVFAVIEMDDAGTDLDALKTPSVFQIYDIFWSAVVILANAEEKVEFEHRDLHIGNICIKPWLVGGTTDIPSKVVSNMSASPASLLGLSGIKTTIIDYTLSRAAQGAEKTDIIFDPFKDASMFTARSKKAEEKRQYDTYRTMHRCVRAVDLKARGTGPSPKRKKKGKQVEMWSLFVPKTNVAWLGYILYVLLLRANGRILPNSSEVAENLQTRMYSMLNDVMEMLDVEDKLPTSAKDLLEVAEESQWLTGEDLRGIKERLEAEAE